MPLSGGQKNYLINIANEIIGDITADQQKQLLTKDQKDEAITELNEYVNNASTQSRSLSKWRILDLLARLRSIMK
jgi:hypothetical protein